MAKQCKCCGKHVPLPTILKDYKEIKLCPTTYENVLEYKRIWNSIGSRPTGAIRKHFSEYVQQIVESEMSNSNV
jgi:hypothetical protein